MGQKPKSKLTLHHIIERKESKKTATKKKESKRKKKTLTKQLSSLCHLVLKFLFLTDMRSCHDSCDRLETQKFPFFVVVVCRR
jgi:hypothetical protein